MKTKREFHLCFSMKKNQRFVKKTVLSIYNQTLEQKGNHKWLRKNEQYVRYYLSFS